MYHGCKNSHFSPKYDFRRFDLIWVAFKRVNIPRYQGFFPKIPTLFNYTHLRQKSNFNDKPCKLTQSIKENISPDFSHSTTILHPQESYKGKAPQAISFIPRPKLFLCKAFVSPQWSRIPNFSCFSCIIWISLDQNFLSTIKLSWKCHIICGIHKHVIRYVVCVNKKLKFNEFNFFIAKASVVVITGVLICLIG